MSEKNDHVENMSIREKMDTYLNRVTGLGGPTDKSNYSWAAHTHWMPTGELNALYEQNAIAAKFVDRIVEDCMRGEYFSLKGEDIDFDFAQLQSQLENLRATSKLSEAWRWARLYGGSITIMIVNDGLPLDRPMNLKRADKLLKLSTIEGRYVIPDLSNPGLGNLDFGLPRYYDLFLPYGNADNQYRVHHSRVLRFDGISISPTRMINNGGWGPSALERPKQAIRALTTAMQYAENVMHDVSVNTYMIEGLREKLQGGKASMEEVRATFELLNANTNNLHCRVLDASDQVLEGSRSVTGLADLIDHFARQVVRDGPYVRSKLLGEQPGGLNNNGQTEVKIYHENAEAERERVLRPVLTRLLHVMFALRKRQGEEVPKEWHIDFKPLTVRDPHEMAETDLRVAQARQIYMDYGVYQPQEVRDMEVKDGNLPESASDLPADPLPAEQPPPAEFMVQGKSLAPEGVQGPNPQPAGGPGVGT